jgi:oxygen-dependent protoporphyrinogen oxidase
MKKVVHVVGAGFAGLTVSLRLAQAGMDVHLYERSDRVGGLLGTEITDCGLAEKAANAMIRTYKAEELFKELDVNFVLPLAESKKRFIFRNVPRRWPLGFLESLATAIKFLPRFILIKKSLFPRPGETLQAWGERSLGSPATEFLLGPAMQGIYGNDVQNLSASLILGPAFTRKQKTGAYRGLISGKNGMQDLVNALETRLKNLGVHIHLNAEIDIKTLTGPVVIATSAHAAAPILQSVLPSLAELLKQVRTTTLLSATLFFKSTQMNFRGFGCLIPRTYKMKSLGVLLNTYIFPHRNRTYSETWILGGADAADIVDAEDSLILKIIGEERFRILKDTSSLLDYRIHRYKKALPLYDLELEKILTEIKTLPLGRVHLHGNYLGGIGLSKILERSDQLAQEISKNG